MHGWYVLCVSCFLLRVIIQRLFCTRLSLHPVVKNTALADPSGCGGGACLVSVPVRAAADPVVVGELEDGPDGSQRVVLYTNKGAQGGREVRLDTHGPDGQWYGIIDVLTHLVVDELVRRRLDLPTHTPRISRAKQVDE